MGYGDPHGSRIHYPRLRSRYSHTVPDPGEGHTKSERIPRRGGKRGVKGEGQSNPEKIRKACQEHGRSGRSAEDRRSIRFPRLPKSHVPRRAEREGGWGGAGPL